MSVLYQHLNFGISVFKDDHDKKKIFDIVEEKKQKNSSNIVDLYHTVLDKNLVNPDLKTLLLDLNLHINLMELFYSPPHYHSFIHVDDCHGDIVKLNWQFFGNHSQMNWHRPIVDLKNNQDNVDLSAPSAIFYQPHEVELIDSTMIQTPTIVQVGTAHNSSNFEQERYVVSIVPVIIDNNVPRRIGMNESLEIFKNYIV
jgi:hypothetical protein